MPSIPNCAIAPEVCIPVKGGTDGNIHPCKQCLVHAESAWLPAGDRSRLNRPHGRSSSWATPSGCPQIRQKLAAEVETYIGHDVVVLPRSSSYLYQHQLVTVDALAEELSKRHEGWYDFCHDHSYVDGEWKVLCCWNSSGAP